MLSAIWRLEMTHRSIWLAGFSEDFARPSVIPPGLRKMRDKLVALDGCRLESGQQLFVSRFGLLFLINGGSSVTIVKHHDAPIEDRKKHSRG
jgi:hypothetical protein